MRARGGIWLFLSWVVAAVVAIAELPLDTGVTGKYLACSVTGQYHKPGRSSSDFARHPSSQEQVMSLQPATASRTPSPAEPAGAPNAPVAPYRLGELALANRLVMSPMTRSRALGMCRMRSPPPITPSAPPPA